MDTVKSLFASKTLWGLVLLAIPTVLGWLGYSATTSDATDIVTQTQSFIEHAIQYVGFVMAFWARIFATKKLIAG